MRHSSPSEPTTQLTRNGFLSTDIARTHTARRVIRRRLRGNVCADLMRRLFNRSFERTRSKDTLSLVRRTSERDIIDALVGTGANLKSGYRPAVRTLHEYLMFAR